MRCPEVRIEMNSLAEGWNRRIAFTPKVPDQTQTFPVPRCRGRLDEGSKRSFCGGQVGSAALLHSLRPAVRQSSTER